MPPKEKNLMASLVRTRQVIAKKYRKLNRNRFLQEKESEAKYAPITNSIKKLIETKSRPQEQKNHSHSNFDDDSDNFMDVENDDDLMQFDEQTEERSQPSKSNESKSQKLLESERKLNVEKRKIQRTKQHDMTRTFVPTNDGGSSKKFIKSEIDPSKNQYDVVRIYASDNNRTDDQKLCCSKRKFSKKPQSCSDKILNSARNRLASIRKNQRTNEHDSFRFNGSESVEKPIQSKRKFSKNWDSNANKILLSARKSLSTSRKKKRTNEHDSFRFNEDEPLKPIQSKRKFSKKPPSSLDKILISEQKSLSLNRKNKRKNEFDTLRFVENEPVKVIKRPKKRQTQIISPEDYDSDGNFVGLATKRRKVERTIKRKPEPKITLSLDDYTKGKFIGLAPKRRKIEITEDKLADFQENQRRMKNRRIKYDGEGLEKKFIPYSENIVYEYYDDPNELVDRLMLLVSSKGAGNTNHDQEINSIVEELRERNIVH